MDLDENIKALYGVTINGTDFTIANEAAYGKTIKFTVKYADATVLKKEKIPLKILNGMEIFASEDI